jgi:glycosyltransferase involved in cell wall biosynthesis
VRIVWLAGWYPTPSNQLAGIFIRRHFLALNKALTEKDTANLYHIHTGDSEASDYHTSKNEHLVEARQSRGVFSRILNAVSFHRRAYLELKDVLNKADLVHVHAGDRIGFWAAWFKQKYGYKLVYTEHWAIYDSSTSDAFENRSVWFRFYMKWLWEKADLIASISNKLYSSMESKYAIRRPFVIFPNVLDQAFEESEKTRVPINEPNEKEVTFLHISNFEKRKNVVELIRATNNLIRSGEKIRLILIGSGSEMFSEKASEHIVIRPSMNAEQLCEYYKQSDVFILPSDAENSPCVIIEAMSFGLPVIATDVGGVSEMINNKNGILIPRFQTPSEKENKISRAILEFLSKSQTFDRNAIIKQAEDQYGSKAVVNELIKQYRQLVCAESPEYL